MLHQLHAAEVQFQHTSAGFARDLRVLRQIEEHLAARRVDAAPTRPTRVRTAAWPRPIVAHGAITAAC